MITSTIAEILIFIRELVNVGCMLLFESKYDELFTKLFSWYCCNNNNNDNDDHDNTSTDNHSNNDEKNKSSAGTKIQNSKDEKSQLTHDEQQMIDAINADIEPNEDVNNIPAPTPQPQQQQQEQPMTPQTAPLRQITRIDHDLPVLTIEQNAGAASGTVVTHSTLDVAETRKIAETLDMMKPCTPPLGPTNSNSAARNELALTHKQGKSSTTGNELRCVYVHHDNVTK